MMRRLGTELRKRASLSPPRPTRRRPVHAATTELEAGRAGSLGIAESKCAILGRGDLQLWSFVPILPAFDIEFVMCQVHLPWLRPVSSKEKKKGTGRSGGSVSVGKVFGIQ